MVSHGYALADVLLAIWPIDVQRTADMRRLPAYGSRRITQAANSVTAPLPASLKRLQALGRYRHVRHRAQDLGRNRPKQPQRCHCRNSAVKVRSPAGIRTNGGHDFPRDRESVPVIRSQPPTDRLS